MNSPYLLTLPDIFFTKKRRMIFKKILVPSDPNWAAWTFRLTDEVRLGLLRLKGAADWRYSLDRFGLHYTFYEQVGDDLGGYLYENYAHVKDPVLIVLPYSCGALPHSQGAMVYSYEDENVADFKRTVNDALRGR